MTRKEMIEHAEERAKNSKDGKCGKEHSDLVKELKKVDILEEIIRNMVNIEYAEAPCGACKFLSLCGDNDECIFELKEE